MLVGKLVVPLNTAVIECEPEANPDVIQVAWPFASKVPEVPKVAAPSLKVTVPSDATGEPPLVTVAVKVTDDPMHEGVREVTMLVAVASERVVSPIAKSPNEAKAVTVAWVVVEVLVPIVVAFHALDAYLLIIKLE